MKSSKYIPVRYLTRAAGPGLNPPQNGKRFARLSKAFQQDAAYWGDNANHYIIAAQTRDSDTVDRSNFQTLQNLIPTSLIERAGHWACGWVEYLIVASDDRQALRVAIMQQCRYADYPILDESHYSQLEYDEFWEYATSELKQYDNWQTVLSDILQSHSGDYTDLTPIEDAATILEELQPLWDSHVSHPIDPAQLPLFADCAPAPLPATYAITAE